MEAAPCLQATLHKKTHSWCLGAAWAGLRQGGRGSDHQASLPTFLLCERSDIVPVPTEQLRTGSHLSATAASSPLVPWDSYLTPSALQSALQLGIWTIEAALVLRNAEL